jgi:hypothetical protein
VTEYASFEDLTSGAEASKEVTLTNGRKVRVRGLSRYEYMLAGKTANATGGSLDPGVFEALIVHFGMVEPKLSEGQVEAWQKSPGGNVDFHRVDREIMELSGFGEGADKSDLREVRDES